MMGSDFGRLPISFPLSLLQNPMGSKIPPHYMDEIVREWPHIVV